MSSAACSLCRRVSSLIERESPWKETMPDLVANISLSSSLSLPRLMQPTSSPDSPESTYPIPVKALAPLHDSKLNSNGVSFSGCTSYTEAIAMNSKLLMESSKLKSGHFLPFLVGAKKMEKCRICDHFVPTDEELRCTVYGCGAIYHVACVKKLPHVSSVKSFKCPLHVCFACNGRPHWRCVQCEVASHDGKCAPWPKLMDMKNHPGRAVCWRHSRNWRHGRMDKPEASTSDIEEIFNRLPLPYEEEEFKFDITLKDMTENNREPPAYVHIRRNVYLVKKKRDYGNRGIGCTSCTSGCSDSCVCRVQCISCSRACHCEETCSNRPFRKEKKIKVVKTELCGRGVEAAEPINKGEFVIEYIGEVIDDALCEKRLWDMKHKGVKNFYMCEISKNFTIDATFKGNSSRFLNHSCDPNCFLEKWQVEGEIRVGVFAARSIKAGEPLTYDYRFIQFGAEVECQCGANNCQGYLGSKRKIGKLLEVCWGSKRKRTSATCIAILAD